MAIEIMGMTNCAILATTSQFEAGQRRVLQLSNEWGDPILKKYLTAVLDGLKESATNYSCSHGTLTVPEVSAFFALNVQSTINLMNEVLIPALGIRLSNHLFPEVLEFERVDPWNESQVVSEIINQFKQLNPFDQAQVLDRLQKVYCSSVSDTLEEGFPN